MSNDFQKWFDQYKSGPGVHKWLHYLEAYDHHFRRFRDQEKVVIFEVGVQSGGSIEMWRAYFGADRVQYFGMDINPATKKFEKEGVTIFIGDQADPEVWKSIRSEVPLIDIFMDDGGHMPTQQIVTLEEMFWHVRDGGVFMCEDLHTSYWPTFEGGYLKPTTMIERCKHLVDALNARHSKSDDLKPDVWTNNMKSIHFYDSLVFIEKGRVENVEWGKRGDQWIPYT